MQTVLPHGTRVRCTFVDMEGLCGRDPHPTHDDIGFVGLITSNRVEQTDDEGCFLGATWAPGGTEVKDDDVVIYTVRNPYGRELKLASYEIERV